MSLREVIVTALGAVLGVGGLFSGDKIVTAITLGFAALCAITLVLMHGGSVWVKSLRCLAVVLISGACIYRNSIKADPVCETPSPPRFILSDVPHMVKGSFEIGTEHPHAQFNVTFRNFGEQPAFGGFWAKLFVLPTPKTPSPAGWEQQYVDLRTRFSEAFREAQINHKVPPDKSFASTQGDWVTLDETLTLRQFADIVSREQTLYIYGRSWWVGMDNPSDVCLQMIAPDVWPPPGSLSWRQCEAQ